MCILIHCIDCGLDVIILLLFFERTGTRRCPLFIDREEGTTPKGKEKQKQNINNKGPPIRGKILDSFCVTQLPMIYRSA
jgi:hypothetical protein